MRCQLVRQRHQLPAAIARRNRRQHRLAIARAKKLHLTARHHCRQQRHVLGETRPQFIQQPAGKMGGETKLRIAIQRVQKRAVAAFMRIVDHAGEIPDRLMRMYAEEQGNAMGHRPVFLQKNLKTD